MAESNDGPVGWWRRHGLTVVILLAAGLVAFLIRTVWAYQLIPQCNVAFCYAGGSDSFYHSRVMQYIIENHQNLIHDPLLNYPLGTINPREPLFDWMNAILGILLAPFFGGNAITAGMWVLEMQDPFWAAVGVVPVYLLGKEVSSRRMGLLAAVLYPLIVGNIESTVATYANYLPFYGFFVLLTLAVYIHAVKLSGTRRWVESYRSPRSIWHGMQEFLRVERASVDWAIFSGVTLGATILAWQGYTYAVAVIMIFFVIALIVERIRRVDSFGMFMVTLITGLIGFPMAMPYYYIQHEFGFWFTVPLLLYFGGLLATLPFLMQRDAPYVISIPTLLGSVGAAAGALYLYNKVYFDAVLTGQGYFVKTLIYSTVAEAQAPSFDALIVSYGVVSFFLAFIGLAFFLAYLYAYRFRREHIFMVVFGLLGIYLPVSAAKFFLLGSPVFALLPAEVLLFLLDRMGYPQLRRNIASLGSQGGWWIAFRRSFKVRHLVVVLIALAVILPNAWYAVDAGIPYNVKSQYNQQIYDTIPAGLRPSAANASGYYLGAAGVETDTPNQYDEAAYNWLATRDRGLPAPDRPALISWWDFGFQVVDEGDHPTVADNFQEGIDPAGNFLLAQNESQAIGILITDLLVAEQQKSGQEYLPASLNQLLAQDGVNLTVLHNDLVNTSQDYTTVLAHPDIYGTFNPATLSTENAMYDAVSEFLASTHSESSVVQIYQDLQRYTGWSIRYTLVDSGLFPSSASNTGIFYAPADLTGRVISSGGIPTQYFQVTVTGSDGNTYPLGQQPPGVSIVNEQISYTPAFYNTMIYRFYAGYNGTEVGAGAGIPGLSGNLTSYNPMPGWMMQHFVLEYRTAYYCPYKDYQAHPNCFSAVNLNTAEALQKAGVGTVDTSASSYYSAGISILEYYPGLDVTGQVLSPSGQPDPGVRVTMLDSWGIPHMTTVTGPEGRYSLIAPPGNDTIAVSYGTLQPLTQTGSNLITEVNITVPSFEAQETPSMVMNLPITVDPGTVSGTVYWNVANTSSYSPSDIVLAGVPVRLTSASGLTYQGVTDPSGTFEIPGVLPGSYNGTVQVGSGTFEVGSVNVGDGRTAFLNASLVPNRLGGATTYSNGRPASGAIIEALELSNGSRYTAVANALGNFSFGPLPPGNYSLEALAPGGYSSPPTPVPIEVGARNITVPLVLSQPIELQLGLSYEGHPVPHFLVRFTDLSYPANGTLAFSSNANGAVVARLTAGNWSAYTYGALNGTWLAGFAQFHLAPGTGTYSAGTLALEPALSLGGTAVLNSTNGPTAGIVVTLESASGAQISTVTNITGGYELFVPEGTYTLEASYRGATAAQNETQLVVVNMTKGPVTLDLHLGPALPVNLLTGYVGFTGRFTPLADVSVQIIQSSTGATLSYISGANGTLPIELPSSGGSYLLRASRAGFGPLSLGPVTESQLLSQPHLNLPVIPVEVNATVLGVPPNVTGLPQLNFTALTPAASNLTVQGFQNRLNLVPGFYDVTGWAPPTTSGSGVYRPLANVTLNIEPGAAPLNFSLLFYPERNYQGQLTLSNGTSASSLLGQASITLSNPTLNLTLNGSRFVTGFSAPAGNYTAWIRAGNSSSPLAFLGELRLTSQNQVSPSTVGLSSAGTLALELQAQGAPLDVSVPVTLSGSGNLSLTVNTTAQGQASLLLPVGAQLQVEVHTTVLRNLSGVLQYEFLRTQTPIPCSINATGSNPCIVPVNVTTAQTNLSLTLNVAGRMASGTAEIFVAPMGASALNDTRVQSFSAAGGTLTLLPGRYTIAAILNPGPSAFVNVTTLTVSYSAQPVPLVLDLGNAWTDTVTVSSVPGLPVPSSLSLNVSSAGRSLTFAWPVVVDHPTPIYLPSGEWVLSARTSIDIYDRPLSLVSAPQNLTLEGNAASVLALVPQYVRSATLVTLGPSTVNAVAGADVTFNLVLTDTGNTPLRLRLAASPGTWPSRIVPANVSLGIAPENDSVPVSVTLTVPNSTLAAHPPVVISAYLASSSATTPLVNATPAPTVDVAPVYRLGTGLTPASNTVGTGFVEIGFYVSATGNAQEEVNLTIANMAALRQEGWSARLMTPAGQAVSNPIVVTPGSSSATYQAVVNLTALSASPLLTASVLVFEDELNDFSASRTLYLSIPHSAPVTIGSSAPVQGPSVGSPSPTASLEPWVPLFAALPGVAIVVGAGLWRWWKTRRWVRR